MECVQELVSQIGRGLSANIGERRYANWFQKSTRLEISGDELIVYASSPYLQSWLQREFTGVIRQVAIEVLGPGSRVRLEVDASLSIAASQATAASVCNNSSNVPSQAEDRHQNKEQGRDAAPRRAASRRRFSSLSEFIASEANQLALTAARQVAGSPGGALNPLCLYGGVGCGKTHLLEGIYRQVRREYPALQVLFLTAENFANYFTQALRERNLPSFHQKFRTVDVLLVDDVDFLCGKRGIEEEFLHTIKSLESDGRQIVLTADRHPRLLTKLSEELVTRMLSGMACRIESPDLEARQQIVRQLVQKGAFPVAEEALDFVARRFSNNVRELEGAMNCLQTYHMMTRGRVSLRAAREILARLERDCVRIVKLADIEKAVCRMFQVTPDELKSARRSRSVSQPRMLAMYLSRRLTACAYSEIGEFFGKRNHSTVMAAERKVRRLIDENGDIRVCAEEWPLKELVDSLESQLKMG
ncbi:MAG: chromosomal replication initiator protein DnaA [Planctomycetaceae bacterium]|nr:chromosomal replication initiator protein DnaA [Planctomycetaceae bacterium]